jgi:hypothetical protein
MTSAAIVGAFATGTEMWIIYTNRADDAPIDMSHGTPAPPPPPEEPFEVRSVSDDVACMWWNDTTAIEDSETACSTIAILRTSPSSLTEYWKRAEQCARISGDGCVLSHEVGLWLPGAFLYRDAVMRLVLAPKITGHDEEDKTEGKRVRVRNHEDVNGKMSSYKLHYNISVEYFDGNDRVFHDENFIGNDAYCIQLLHHSVPDSCWKSLFG